MSYDNVCKYLAEQYPAEFAKWLLAIESTDIEVLKTELTLEPIRADALTFLRTANQILHLEFQTLPYSEPAIPFRMLDYSVRLKRQYRCTVTQVVIFLQETTNQVAFTQEYRDDTTTHHYRVLRLWEQDSTPFLTNPALLSCYASKLDMIQLGNNPSNPQSVSPSPRLRVCFNKQFKSVTAYP